MGGTNFVEKEATTKKETRDEETIIGPVAAVEATGEMIRGKIIGGEDNSGIIIKEEIGITMGEVGEGIMMEVGPQ